MRLIFERRGARAALIFLTLCGLLLCSSAWGANWQELCESGDLEGIREALKTASADDLLPGGNRPLHVAAEYARTPEVIRLLTHEGASLSAVGLEGLTPLMLAAAYNPEPSILEALLSAGASLDAAGANGRTPLLLAASMNPSPQVTAALLRHGASVRSRDSEGRTPLWLAAARADPQAVALLLDANAPVDEANRAGVTPLQAACERPNAEVFRLLVEAGADTNRRDANRSTPVMRAVSVGADAAALEALIQGRADLLAEDDQNRGPLFLAASNLKLSTDAAALLIPEGEVDTRESGLMTPLMEACRADNLPMVRLLLDRGASLSLRDRNDWSPMMFAAAGASPAMLRLLAERGASLTDETRQGLTPLMVGIEAGTKAESIRTLLELGADPNHRNIQDITPLMMSIAVDRGDILKLLLEAKADPDLSTWDGLTPLMVTARRPESGGLIRTLVSAGADVNRKSLQGMTALMVASASGNLPAVVELLNLSADVSAQDRDGMTPLSHVVQSAKDAEELLNTLVRAGADVDVRMAREMTPLMDAALRGSAWAVKGLLAAGTNVRAGDFIGWTPLHFAVKGSTGPECARLLVSADALVDAPDSGGTTPLMVAAAGDNAEGVKVLLDAGADPRRADRTGRNALSYAIFKKSKSCIPLLEGRAPAEDKKR